MIQPGNSYHLQLDRYPFWAADNGAFTKKRTGFDPDLFRAMLGQPEVRAHAGRCLFVVAPDVLRVLPDGTVIGDAKGTLEAFPEWARVIKAHGLPVALVAQDGLERLLGEVPWDLLDVLFIGGSDEWKLSDAARCCIVEAKRRGKRAHMGRVNSFKRLERAGEMLYDSVDGTFLLFGPDQNLPRLLAWLDRAGDGIQAHLPWGNA